MHNKSQVFIGALLLVLGVLLFVGRVADIRIARLFWPLLLIVLGIWSIARTRWVDPETPIRQRLAGDIRRRGTWQVANEEFWLGLGDVHLDLTEAEIPTGETELRCYGLLGSVRLVVPADVAVSVTSTAVISTIRVFGRKRDSFIAPVTLATDDYEEAERRICIESSRLLGDVRVKTP